MMKRLFTLTGAVLMLCLILCVPLYANSFMPAQEEAFACITSPAENVSVIQQEKRLVFIPQKAIAGLVFYLGGNVAAESYAPLLEALAERGILCILHKMPLSLAILDTDAARGVQAEFPQVARWYLGGHSLGGYAAAAYLSDTQEQYDGLILLAAYTQSDLTQSGLDVLSIYGSEDGVLSKERYAQGLPLLPDDYEEIVIDGGCHSYFGAYGMQRGDGIPGINREVQIKQTADAVAMFIGRE